MTPEDYEAFITKVEKKFLPDFESLQDAATITASCNDSWLHTNLSGPRLVTESNYQPTQWQYDLINSHRAGTFGGQTSAISAQNQCLRSETTLEVYQRCKEALRRAVYGE